MSAGGKGGAAPRRDRGRGLAPVLVALPLGLAGLLAAHEVAYRIVGAHHHGGRDALLEESGHGYLEHAPALIWPLAALGAIALLARAGGAASRRLGRAGDGPRRRGLGPWAFGAMPLLAFAIQEHAERLAHTGALPVGAAVEPTFLLGLALQLPFAAAAWGLARLLLRLADAVGERIGAGLPDEPAPMDLPALHLAPLRARPAPLALRRGGRGPPALPV